MFKHILIALAVFAVASAQYLYGDYGQYSSAPSFHGPFATSTNTGIRRFGSTAGYVAAPAYYSTYAAAPYAAAAYY